MRKSGMWKMGAATVALMTAAGVASADAPRVAVDIAPVHGLVARVMQGVGEPSLVVQPGASPHGYSLRPSEAQALDQADLVFWIGEALTPWLQGPLEKLAHDAHRVELLEVAGTTQFAFREGARFEAHDHGDHEDHGEHGHDDHGHEGHDHGENDHDDHGHEGHDHGENDHDDHGHEGHDHGESDHDDHGHEGHDHGENDHDDHGHEGHDHGEDGHDEHGHHHDGVDPHAWLLPKNAQLWLDVIADELAEHDPENAATYRENAEAGKQEIAAAAAEVSAKLEPFQERQFIVFHDAYQYFEQGFGLAAAGAISLGDAAKPSPARVAEVREVVAELNVSCVFSEPQFNPGLVATVLDGTGAGTAVLDPLGTSLEPGPQFYPMLLQSLGAAIADCK